MDLHLDGWMTLNFLHKPVVAARHFSACSASRGYLLRRYEETSHHFKSSIYYNSNCGETGLSEVPAIRGAGTAEIFRLSHSEATHGWQRTSTSST